MDDQPMTFQHLKNEIDQEIEIDFDEIRNEPDSEIDIYERVNNNIPGRTGQLLDVIRSDEKLWAWVPEIDTGSDLREVMVAIIYEALAEHAQQAYRRKVNEMPDELRGDVGMALREQGEPDLADEADGLSDEEILEWGQQYHYDAKAIATAMIDDGLAQD